MDFTQGETKWHVKNTFVEVLDDSNSDDRVPVGRSRTSPALLCTAVDQESQDVRKERQPKVQICLMDTIDTMPAMTLDSMPSLVVDTLGSLPDLGDELAVEIEESDLFCYDSCLPSLFQRSGQSSAVDVSNASNKPPPKAQCARQQGAATNPDHAEASTTNFPSPVTTLMLGNLPYKLSQEGLARVVDELGFRGAYDLIYMPLGPHNHIGYGFINFLTPEAASCFACLSTSLKFSGAKTIKQVRVVAAKTQGFEQTLAFVKGGDNFRKRSHAPLIFGKTSLSSS